MIISVIICTQSTLDFNCYVVLYATPLPTLHHTDMLRHMASWSTQHLSGCAEGRTVLVEIRNSCKRVCACIVLYYSHPLMWWNCRSLRCSWSIACRRCSNYIFILDLISDFKGFGKDRHKTLRESFKCCDLVRLILETWRYTMIQTHNSCQRTHF